MKAHLRSQESQGDRGTLLQTPSDSEHADVGGGVGMCDISELKTMSEFREDTDGPSTWWVIPILCDFSKLVFPGLQYVIQSQSFKANHSLIRKLNNLH